MTSDEYLLQDAADFAKEYLRGLRHRKVLPDVDAIRALDAFDEPMPEQAGDPREMLGLLHRVGSPATVAQDGGRYFGFVNGGVLPPALAARWLADAWDQNAALHVMSPVAAKIEEVCEGWLIDLLGLQPGSAAGFVSGTSTALVAALAAARDCLLARRGWDVAARGLFDAPKIRVVLGASAHATVLKALAILGLGRERVEVVPADEQGRMDAKRLPPLDSCTLVVCQAGNVNSGSFDPIKDICRAAREVGAWVHVDGAFGLWAAASSRRRALCAGIELADSCSVDAHKTLNAPYDCGIVLCADRSALQSALRANASYLASTEGRDGMLFTLEMSRRARAIDVWAILKTLGRAGVEELIEQLCQHASNLASLLATEGFEILNDVVFNQVLVRCASPKQTREVLGLVQASAECWCGGTSWNDLPAIRISVCSWRTNQGDIQRVARAFGEALAKTTCEYESISI
jgi:glutamate/tyrosine decarboxylase-like PLP-dependent enzyme